MNTKIIERHLKMEKLIEQLALEDEIEQKFNNIENELEEEIKLKEEERKLKEEEKEEKNEIMKVLAFGINALHHSGKSNNEIANTFGISLEEIALYLNNNK